MGLLGGLRRPSPELAAKLQIEERELERAGFVWGGAGQRGALRGGRTESSTNRQLTRPDCASPRGSCTLLRVERWVD